MKPFAELYRSLDETTKTSRKVAAMRKYFSRCNPADGAWAVYFLSGRRFKRLIPTGALRLWSAETAQIPDWLFDECYSAVGDLAETMALLWPERAAGPTSDEGPEAKATRSLTAWIEDVLQPLPQLDDATKRVRLDTAWNELSTQERFVFNKLVTGSFRVGVSQGLVVRALAEASGLEPAVIAHRLMGNWEPTADFFQSLLADDDGEADCSRPYPFCLAHPLLASPASLGDISHWLVEWKWDGIRAQMIRRRGQSFVWSRGEELILDRFPELQPVVDALADGTVFDGEIVAWKDGAVLPFGELQRRIGRKTVGRKLLSEIPCRFIVFDLLERGGDDLRQQPLNDRRTQLEVLLARMDAALAIQASPLVEAPDWETCERLRTESRDRHVEGLMLKRCDSVYAVGRTTGLWWKWKVHPYTCDAVLVYAQRGHGRRASLYTDYTFAAWHEGQLVPFAKAYSGLTDAEIREVDRFVRKNTIERFGPVRAVKPELVFELAFEGIQISKRHKSGIAVRFPRMNRWRTDKRPEDADSLDAIKALLPAAEGA